MFLVCFITFYNKIKLDIDYEKYKNL